MGRRSEDQEHARGGLGVTFDHRTWAVAGPTSRVKLHCTIGPSIQKGAKYARPNGSLSTLRGGKLKVDRSRGHHCRRQGAGPDQKAATGGTCPKRSKGRRPFIRGRKVNVNHRDVQQRAGLSGSFRRAAKRHGRFGLACRRCISIRSHALAEQLIWDAEHAPENVRPIARH